MSDAAGVQTRFAKPNFSRNGCLIQGDCCRMNNAILVVDDNVDLCRTLSRLLRHMGFESYWALSGKEALSQLREIKPALILLDYMMPNMDGLEVLTQVKSDAHTAAIPVVMLTAVSDEVTADTALSKGAAAYWIKGRIDYDQLREDVAKFIPPQDSNSLSTPGD
jgi:CheY-like chemotaxis protein